MYITDYYSNDKHIATTVTYEPVTEEYYHDQGVVNV